VGSPLANNGQRRGTAAQATGYCTTITGVCGVRPAGSERATNPAVKGVHENNSAAPVTGASSFTKGEATSQIEAKGYSHVTSLKKGKDGVWRGKATKNGQTVPVTIDYQGNVN
jgi:hypothetical protein